jgi:hypothetical protein
MEIELFFGGCANHGPNQRSLDEEELHFQNF